MGKDDFRELKKQKETDQGSRNKKDVCVRSNTQFEDRMV